jgi:hypothetical protein
VDERIGDAAGMRTSTAEADRLAVEDLVGVDRVSCSAFRGTPTPSRD